MVLALRAATISATVTMDRNALWDRVHEGIIVCSDRRLRPTLDRLYNNGRRVIVSTGGANVASVSDTVRELTARGVRRWTVLAHTDTTDIAKGCRWVGQAAVEVQAKLAGTKLPQQDYCRPGPGRPFHPARLYHEGAHRGT